MKPYDKAIHIQCGSIPFLTKALKSSSGEKKYSKAGQISYFQGMRVIQNPAMPPQVVAIVDKQGKFLHALNLKSE